jgi:hypothetical protein
VYRLDLAATEVWRAVEELVISEMWKKNI